MSSSPSLGGEVPGRKAGDLGFKPANGEASSVGSLVVSALVVGLLIVASFGTTSLQNGEKLSLSLIFGALFGFVLQRSRFCFFCLWRDWLDHRDPRGLLGIIAALAVGIAGYAIVF